MRAIKYSLAAIFVYVLWSVVTTPTSGEATALQDVLFAYRLPKGAVETFPHEGPLHWYRQSALGDGPFWHIFGTASAERVGVWCQSQGDREHVYGRPQYPAILRAAGEPPWIAEGEIAQSRSLSWGRWRMTIDVSERTGNFRAIFYSPRR